jgi:prostaglandin-endoperoxide synthase 2
VEVSRAKSKPPRGGDLREILEFFCMGPFVTALLRPFPPLYRLANRYYINNAIKKVKPPRPYRLSTKAAYTSWDTLTDRSYSARELPPTDHVLESPTPAELKALFTRTEFKPSPKSSLLFAYFAQWFTDGVLRSDRSVIDPKTKKIKEPRDITKNESTHEVDLAQLYGLTSEDGEMLRSRTDRALLAYQEINGEEYPPDLFANGKRVRQFERLRIIGAEKDDVAKGELLAMGSDAGNTQIGYSMFNTLFLRAHNKIAREIRTAQGDAWDDDRVFAASRNVLVVLMIKLIIEEYINHISPWAFQFKFDPTGFEREKWRRQNWMAVEFNLLYRWHCLLPPELMIGGRPHALSETMFRTRTLFAEHGLGALLEEASQQPAGAIELFNVGDRDGILLKTAELPTIKAGRAVKLQSYNEYRKHCGFAPARRFEDFSSDANVVTGLKELYKDDVDAVEFYPGLFAEDRVTNSVVPPLMGRLIAVHAFSQLLTNPLLAPAVYKSDETFSARGRELMGEITGLKKLIDWVLPDRGERGYNVGLSICEPEVVKMKGVDRPKRDSPFLATYDTIAAANAPQLQGGLLMKWLLERPADLFAELRDTEPIFVTPVGVVVSRYDDVTTVAERDDVFGVKHYGESMERYLDGGNFLLGMDDDKNGEFDRDRALLRLAIRRTDLEDISDHVAARARRILDRSGGRIELADAYGRTICAKSLSRYYFGKEGPRARDLMAWCRDMYRDIFINFGRDPGIQSAGEQAGQRFRTCVDDLVAAHHRNGRPLGDSVLGRLIAQQAVGDAGASFSDRRIRDNLIGSTVGVIDNVGCAVANAFDVLLDRPQEFENAVQAARDGDDKNVLRYVWEALRFHPAASVLVRRATQDFTLAPGTDRQATIPAKTLVFAASGSAMMDERKLTDPMEFDLDRPPQHYMHYGWGMHRCLGLHVANAQLTEMAKALLLRKNLRRADGESGKLTYDGPFPTPFVLQFDP